MRPVVAVAVASLSIGCAGACSPRQARSEPPQHAKTPASAAPSEGAPPERIAKASYGETFPRLDAVPGGLGAPHGLDAKLYSEIELRLIVQPEAAALPFAKRLVSEVPDLAVIVYANSLDERTSAWLSESGMLRFEDEGALRRTLDALARDPRLGNHLAKVTAPWPSMAVADGIAREPEEACLFHGPWLVWAGLTADALYPAEQAALGAWSRKALDEYEGIRDQINELAKALFDKRPDLSKQMVKRILARPDAQPRRLLDLAAWLTFTLQDLDDLALAYRLVDRAVKDTRGLEHSVLWSAAFVRYMLGDPKGAVEFARRSLALCEEVQSDCVRIKGNLANYERCPRDLVELSEPVEMGWVMRFTTRLKPGVPADCWEY
jgi:hypothetical protein